MVDEGATGGWTKTRDDIDDTGRESGLDDEAAEEEGCQLVEDELRIRNTEDLLKIELLKLTGVCSAGLRTTTFPAAKAGANFQDSIKVGKFQGI